MAFCSTSEVLYEAGQLKRFYGAKLIGTTDGANTIFTVEKAPIVDSNYDDTVDTTDVVAYDDGAVVATSTLVPGSGSITLSSAPAASSVMTVDYAWSMADTTMAAQYIAEATHWITTEMKQVETLTEPVNVTIRKITRTYAAGLMMIAEYGTQGFSNESEKEGKRKIELAERWLAAYRMRVESNEKTESGADAPSSSTDKRLFEEYDSTNGWTPLDDSDVDFNTTS